MDNNIYAYRLPSNTRPIKKFTNKNNSDGMFKEIFKNLDENYVL